jgi:hypothetical protein
MGHPSSVCSGGIIIDTAGLALIRRRLPPQTYNLSALGA